MSFIAPTAFFLSLLLPVIIAMYLLKLRRTEQVVPSVYLWRRMVRDVEANAPWQRLRRNLLLLIQLLFLAALIFALARPFTWWEGASGQAAIFIIDTSASMGATDATPNRLEAAKAQARQLANDLPDEARVTIITAGDRAQVLTTSSQDSRQIQSALESIQLSTGGSDLTAALQLASAIASRQPDTDIVVLSDGRVTLPDRLALQGRVRYFPIGTSGENQAISLLTAEIAPGGQTITAFAQITNYGETQAQNRLEIYADGTLVHVFDLDIPSGEQRAVLAENLPVETRLVEARLTGADSLPLDNQAWAPNRNTDPPAIRLVSEGNLFLETGLDLLPGFEINTILPADYRSDTSPEQEARITIFDGFVPMTDTLPTGNLLFIAPIQSTDYFSVTGTIAQPELRPAETTDPLLANVSLDQISVLDAADIPLPLWARPVILGDHTGGSTSLLFAGEADNRRIAVLSFDLRHSDLPLQIAFPLLLANLTGWLAPHQGGEIPEQISPGSPIAFSLPIGIETAVITRPDGSRIRVSPAGNRFVFADTQQLGTYRIGWGEGEETSFAANLFSPTESNVRPAGTLGIEGEADEVQGETTGGARREWWRSLAFAALGLLTSEWLVYHRGTLVKVWEKLRNQGNLLRNTS